MRISLPHFWRPVALLVAGIALASPAATPLDSATGEWLPVTDRSLEIVAGSPLDFSALAGDLAGNAPLAVDGDRLVLGGGAPRINCAMLGPGFSTTPHSGFPDHPTADRYAEQLRRHGYNLVRFHHVDSLLMTGAREDFAFDPVQLDRLQYLMAALKRNGLRWSLDLMTSDNAALGGVFPNRWSERRGMRIRVYAEPAALRHWQTLATRLLTDVNPYTRVPPARDPATALVVLLNEGVIEHQARIADRGKTGRFPDLLKAPYAEWLRAKGQDPAAAETLPAFGDRGPAIERFQTFLTAIQLATTRVMTDTVRAAGYPGPVTGFDSWAQLNEVPTRRALELVDMHTYDQVPPGGQPGARVRSVSSLPAGVPYLATAAGTRFFGRPFTLTEYDQPFWNAFRYESGLAVPAMASLQGWQFVCRHADGPIDLAYDGVGPRKTALQPDGGGLDPVARAGETLTALLLLRREIAPLRVRVGFAVSDAEALADGGGRELPSALESLAWVARIGLVDARSRPAAGPLDLTLSVGAAPSATERMAAAVRPSVAEAGAALAALRARGALPRRNPSDPAADRWQSPGGQVRVDGAERMLRVLTPFTAALAFERLAGPVSLGPLRVTAADAPALLGVSALDGRPLGDSRRVLVVLASDARNTGMRVAPDGTLVALGMLPIALRRVRVAATLAAPAGSGWRLAALRLNGTPDPAVTLRAGASGLDLSLDTALSPRGPTTFFMLERD